MICIPARRDTNRSGFECESTVGPHHRVHESLVAG